MTWFATDDGFPEHPKVDRLEALSAGDWSRYAAARMVWHDMGCDCARRLTDGAFLRVRAHRVCRLPREVVDVALADLVGAGLILAAGDGFAFHDWSAYQPTRAKVEAMRASKTERQRRWRERVDASTGASTNASTASSRDASTGASTAASRDASVDAAPSPPLPIRKTGQVRARLTRGAVRALTRPCCFSLMHRRTRHRTPSRSCSRTGRRQRAKRERSSTPNAAPPSNAR